jgi:hypothetical protein
MDRFKLVCEYKKVEELLKVIKYVLVQSIIQLEIIKSVAKNQVLILA